jgi:hypothetical protein
MDLSLVGAAVTALNGARTLGKAAVEIRDFSKLATVVSEMNEKLLEAQDKLFAHNTQLLQLQGEYFETAKKLRDAEEALAKRARYTLVAIGDGAFVYRSNPVPPQSGSPEPIIAEPEHFVCQPCYDAPVSRLVVLQPLGDHGNLTCTVCRTRYIISNRFRSLRPPSAYSD